MKHIVHIGYDDWAGLYVEGDLYYEGHSVPMSQLEHAADGEPFTFEDVDVDEARWYSMISEHGGRLPDAYNAASVAAHKEDT